VRNMPYYKCIGRGKDSGRTRKREGNVLNIAQIVLAAPAW